MKKLFLFVLTATLIMSCKKEVASETATVAAVDAGAPSEIADAKYMDIGKNALAAMTKGDMDDWTANFASDAKYYWNGGDSLVGKPAIDKFWRERRTNVIETISFANDIWLPIKVNKPQRTERPGVWLMGWYQVTAKYKGGTSMTQWMHVLYHFNESDEIDQVNHFVDRVPIQAAMAQKK